MEKALLELLYLCVWTVIAIFLYDRVLIIFERKPVLKKKQKTIQQLRDNLYFYRGILDDLPIESKSFQVIKVKVQKIEVKLIKLSYGK